MKSHSVKRRKATICYNCQTALLNSENYCPQCGQENHSKQASIRLLFNDFLSDYLTFDSRLFRSIVPLVTDPGRITVEYLNGKRQRFIPPVRVFLFLSFLYFGLSYLTGNESSTLELSVNESERAAQAVTEAFQKNFNILLFLYTPLFAVIIRLLFRSEKRDYYVNFFVFTLHLFSFFFIIGIIQLLFFGVINALFSGDTNELITMVVQLGFLVFSFVYTIISLKKVFDKKYTFLRFVGVLVISLVAFLTLLILAIIILFLINL